VGTVDLDALARDRDQLWAEAVALFNAEEHWWLDRADEGAAAAVVATRAADDPWTADVLRVVEKLSEASTRDVFQLMEVALERRTKPDEMRIGGILTRAGWTKVGKFTGGPNRGLGRYVAPTGGGA
jgi:predicted P-loop ATPase